MHTHNEKEKQQKDGGGVKLKYDIPRRKMS
jgi:hypothetical protein